jgi:hypothetical protein
MESNCIIMSWVSWFIFMVVYIFSFDRSIIKVSEILLTNFEERLISKQRVNLLYLILISGCMIVIAAFVLCMIAVIIYIVSLIIMLLIQYLPFGQLLIVANIFNPSTMLSVFNDNVKLHIAAAKIILTCIVITLIQFTHTECTSTDAETLSRLQFKMILIYVLSITIGILYYLVNFVKLALK